MIENDKYLKNDTLVFIEMNNEDLKHCLHLPNYLTPKTKLTDDMQIPFSISAIPSTNSLKFTAKEHVQIAFFVIVQEKKIKISMSRHYVKHPEKYFRKNVRCLCVRVYVCARAKDRKNESLVIRKWIELSG